MIWEASPNIGLIPQYALSDRPSEKDGGPSLALGSLRVSEEGFASKSGSEMPRLKSNFWHEICILFGMNANGTRNERKEEMKEQKTIKTVATVEDWWKNHNMSQEGLWPHQGVDQPYWVVGTYTDGSRFQGWFSEDEWKQIKAEEQQNELLVLSVPNPTPVVDRQALTPVNTHKHLGFSREEQINAYRRMPDSFLLCAWCRCYVSRSTMDRVFSLTLDEFEATRHTGESHGMCKGCYNR